MQPNFTTSHIRNTYGFNSQESFQGKSPYNRGFPVQTSPNHMTQAIKNLESKHEFNETTGRKKIVSGESSPLLTQLHHNVS